MRAVFGYVEQPFACIKVRDFGRGFPSGQTKSLFKIFSRAESESALPGVGLGLAICQAIIEAHGGSISAENLQDGGAAVTLYMPLGNPPEFRPEEASA